eukprot:GHVH01013855.1.p1 GENE.GHVH01013855.1~~GHVH01013855.1.p1  ORF type:complete len:158 (+),score=7.10 GHVH01013855.1:347-820(+)
MNILERIRPNPSEVPDADARVEEAKEVIENTIRKLQCARDSSNASASPPLDRPIKKGDCVFIDAKFLPKRKGQGLKLLDPYVGPFRVTKVSKMLIYVHIPGLISRSRRPFHGDALEVAKGHAAPLTECSWCDEEPEYEVERIHRDRTRRGKREYEVE